MLPSALVPHPTGVRLTLCLVGLVGRRVEHILLDYEGAIGTSLGD